MRSDWLQKLYSVQDTLRETGNELTRKANSMEDCGNEYMSDFLFNQAHACYLAAQGITDAINAKLDESEKQDAAMFDAIMSSVKRVAEDDGVVIKDSE